METTITLKDWELKAFKEYFSINDKSSFEHLAFEIFSKATPTTLEAENKELREMLQYLIEDEQLSSDAMRLEIEELLNK